MTPPGASLETLSHPIPKAARERERTGSAKRAIALGAAVLAILIVAAAQFLPPGLVPTF